MTSPASYTKRPYADEADRQAMTRLLIASRPHRQLASFPSPQDLHEIIAQLPDRYQIALWEDDVRSVTGFAIVDLVYNNLYFEIASGATDNRIAAEAIEWASGCLRHVASGVDPDLTLDTICFEDDAWRLARALMLTGLRKLKERGAEMVILETSSENVAMQQAAESAGFLLAWSKVWLSKPITKGGNTTRVLA